MKGLYLRWRGPVLLHKQGSVAVEGSRGTRAQACGTRVWLMDFDIHPGSAGRRAMSSLIVECGSLRLSVVNASAARRSPIQSSARTASPAALCEGSSFH